jgi:hypothetical protein
VDPPIWLGLIHDATTTHNSYPMAQLNGVGVQAPRTVVTVTSSTTIGANANSDYLVLIGASGAPTLPNAVGNLNRYTFKNIDSSSHTVSTTSSQTIDGSTTATVTAGASTEVISDGANWRSV